MRSDKGKLYWVHEDGAERIRCIPYDEKEDYKTYISRCRMKGYRAVTLHTDPLLEIVRILCSRHKVNFLRMTFSNDDDNLNYAVSHLVKSAAEDPQSALELKERVQTMCEEPSVTLEKVYINGRLSDGRYCMMTVCSNGILTINRECYQSLSDEIRALVENMVV